MDFVQHNNLAAAGAVLSVLAALILTSLLAPPEATALLVEGGPVETLTAILHFLVAAAAFALWWRRGGLFGLLGIAALAMGARELDLDKAFTTHSVFSTKQYFHPEAPLPEKLLAGAAVVVLLVLAVWLVRISLPALRSLARQKAPAFWSIVTVLATLPLLKTVDALPRILRENGMELGPHALARLMALEEVGELALPLLVALVLVQLLAPVPERQKKKTGRPLDVGHPVLRR
ncbi:MAG TPA: hypothetical protein VNS22_28005 [Geminicoccus sp.]|uniref:hypothetical protein n=1 Tax=Geminicoccus sp. TaxID=2024832 RepID=UPI002BF23B9B|nr:hypothetical protein [Geminicoccus sp.]HWL72203.1 hypothetical protein [Geminicoccus sp.]